MGGRKRTRARGTDSTRGKQNYDPESTVQQKYVTYKKGRKLTTRQMIDRTVLAQSDSLLFRFKNYRNDIENSTSFEKDLGQYQSLAANKHYLPCYVFNLDCVLQGSNPTANAYQTSFCKRMFTDYVPGSTVDGKDIRWEDVYGTDSVGSATFGSFPYRLTDPDPTGSTLTKALMKWVDMKFNIMGAKTRPTKVFMELVQVKDDDYDPWKNSAVSQENDDASAYWQWYVTRGTTNAIHQQVKPVIRSKPFRVLDTKTFVFQPASTQDQDSRGQITTVKWFYRPNKVIDFTSGERQFRMLDNVDLANYKTGTNLGTIPGTRASKGNLLLVVRAFSPIVNGSFTPNTDPSFEWNITTAYQKLDRN